MKRTIGLISVFCISAGAMISSGLFILPGLAFAEAGPAVFLSYLIAGSVALTTVLSLSELITAMPKAGGDYYYVSRSFGLLFGTVSGLLSWLALSLKSAFAIIGIAELIYISFGVNLTLSALILAVLFTAVNIAGVQEAVRLQVALVVLLLLILIVFSITGVQQLHFDHFTEFLPNGLNSLFSTAGFVFVSYGGVLTTASIAGEVKNPSRTIPLGLIGSTVIVTLLYTAVIFFVVGTVPGGELAQSLAPIAIAGKETGGELLYFAIMFGSLLAFITTANGGILTASRYPVALGQDKMLPGLFSTMTKNQTPVVSITATGILICFSLLLELSTLIKAASTVILLSNIFAHLSVIVMRESRIKNYRPSYRSPLYPWLQVISIVIFSALLIDMGIVPMLLALLFISAGVILYFFRKGESEKQSAAIIHLIKRITNKAIVTDGLQKELREIVEDREGIIHDAVDTVIETSKFIEIDEHLDHIQLWKRISNDVLECIRMKDISRDDIEQLFQQREIEASTVISPFVAIPHLVVSGEKEFSLILIRAQKGIFFDDRHSEVKALFVLLGSRDMRNLHLRTLTAIAHLAQQADFESEWLSAKTGQELIDFFVLSDRRRMG
jgi:APA family basic amino acid/polyamine antiporter